MTFRFAVIGDSLAQGVHGGAIGDTHWSFPAILARAIGLEVGTSARADFRVPHIPGDGLPINLVRGLEVIGDAMREPVAGWKWLVRAVPALARQLRRTEDFYERGPGTRPLEFTGVYHNLAMYGLKLRESDSLTSDRCDHAIALEEGSALRNLFGLPGGHRQRAARIVLNPARSRARGSATQLDNLEFLVRGNRALGIEAEPLDALIVWLGSNDCLQTVVQLELRDMPATGRERDHEGRVYNLTAELPFATDFELVAERLAWIFKGSRTRVYVGNVPDITIPPIAKGLGGIVPGTNVYRHYGRFFLDEGDWHWPFKTLSHEDAAVIQQRIDAYNRHIERACETYGFKLVDAAGVLQDLAVRRHAEREPAERAHGAQASQDLQQRRTQLARQRMQVYADRMGIARHPLLELDPVPSVLMLETDREGRRVAGGLTSIDGVHPSTVGYGIAAEGFLKRLQVDFPSLRHASIPWPKVIYADRVLRKPPSVWDDFLRLLTSWQLPSDWLFRVLPLG